jgi:hypothetical protein
MKNPVKLLIVAGLALGVVCGMAGTMVASANLRNLLWCIDSTGLIVATLVLALHFFRAQNDLVAAGFLVYAIGESVMLSGTAASLEASVPAFAAGTALWSAAFFLTSIPKTFALWTRGAGIVAAILFAITALTIFSGHTIDPLTKPIPYFAYPFLALTLIGWMTSVFKKS